MKVDKWFGILTIDVFSGQHTSALDPAVVKSALDPAVVKISSSEP